MFSSLSFYTGDIVGHLILVSRVVLRIGFKLIPYVEYPVLDSWVLSVAQLYRVWMRLPFLLQLRLKERVLLNKGIYEV